MSRPMESDDCPTGWFCPLLSNVRSVRRARAIDLGIPNLVRCPIIGKHYVKLPRHMRVKGLLRSYLFFCFSSTIHWQNSILEGLVCMFETFLMLLVWFRLFMWDSGDTSSFLNSDQLRDYHKSYKSTLSG